MSRLGLIVQREYCQIVAKRSFIFTTILVPILSIVLCGVLPVWLSSVKSDEKKTVAIVDDNPGQSYAKLFADTEDYRFTLVEPFGQESLHEYYNASGGELYAIVRIPEGVESNACVHIYSSQAVSASLESDLRHVIEPSLRSLRVASYHIDSLEHIIADCNVPLSFKNIRWGDDGSESISSAQVSELLGLALALLTYMFVIMYGAMIMNGVVEEKSNRIVEVIISSCKPIELMLGKIIGVALVGFTQIAVWGVLLFVAGGVIGAAYLPSATSPEIMVQQMGGDSSALVGSEPAAAIQAMAEVQQGGKMAEIIQSVMGIDFALIFICFTLYFIGGYLLYASLFAAFGSAVDQQGDTSQFMSPIMIVMVFALYAGLFSINNPDGPLATWCSMIPFTSPIVMMIRLPFDVPFWQLALSLLLLYAVAFGLLYLAGRIYRTGILMYGKKFTLREILRWIKA